VSVPREVFAVSREFGVSGGDWMATLWNRGVRQPSAETIRAGLIALGLPIDDLDVRLDMPNLPRYALWRREHPTLVLLAWAWFRSDFDPDAVPLLASAGFLASPVTPLTWAELDARVAAAVAAKISPAFFRVAAEHSSAVEMVRHWHAGTPVEYLAVSA